MADCEDVNEICTIVEKFHDMVHMMADEVQEDPARYLDKAHNQAIVKALKVFNGLPNDVAVMAIVSAMKMLVDSFEEYQVLESRPVV